MTDVARNCRLVRQRIEEAAVRSGRSPQSVRLVAVTKTVTSDRIREAAACGVVDIGENKVQEALAKRPELIALPMTWHFIGHFQTNKAKKIAENFQWVHSVDRVDVAEALARNVHQKALPILIEVKLDDKSSKSGVSPAELQSLTVAFRHYETLDLRGLMSVPPPSEDPEHTRPHFRRLRQLANEFGLTELSMGMSHDFEIAIEEGATMVRIGTAIFGERA